MVMPIYEGTAQIQALMAMKDTLGGILKNPQRFVRRGAQARWRALSSRDGLERAVARIQSLSFSAQQHLILRTAGDKLKATTQKPLAEWPRQFLKNWNPKRDFAYAMLHAERLDAHSRRRSGRRAVARAGEGGSGAARDRGALGRAGRAALPAPRRRDHVDGGSTAGDVAA